MTVYIEYVIIDNFVLTYLIASAAYRLARIRPSPLRTALAAGAGTVAAVFYPFIPWTWAALSVKIALGAGLCCLLFCGKPRFFWGTLCFFGVTFLAGGAFFAAGYLVYGDAVKALTLPAFDFPVGLILFFGAAVYVVVRRSVTTLHRRRAAADCTYRFEVCYGGQRLDARGFLDTGNRLFDPVSGLPVVVLGMRAALRFLGDEELTLMMQGRGEELSGARYVECGTISGESRILLIKPDRFRLYFDDCANTLIDVMLGLSFCVKSKDYDAILSPSLFS